MKRRRSKRCQARRRRARWRVGALLLGLLAGASTTGVEARAASQDGRVVTTAALEGDAITPGTVRYLSRALRQAEEQGAECFVLQLDTPGGLLTSTRELVKQVLGSGTPVVVHVAPSGSRAASAGVFVTMAAHVAAMAPGTTIGAAHPVQIGGLPGAPGSPAPGGEQDGQGGQASQDGQDGPTSEARGGSAPSPLQEKVLNDTVAWARTLAELRGRSAAWAQTAVEDSVVASAEEAVAENVVDLVAADLDTLLGAIDGREVELASGEVRVLRTAGASIERVEMWWGERILALIGEPNVAFLLLMLGFYGVLFEFYSPGWGVPGTLGALCILLGLFGLSLLPVNYLGLALVFAALAMIVAEVFVTSFGLLAIGGALCLVLGGSMLVDSPSGYARISLSLLVPVAAATAVLAVFLVSGIVRAQRQPVHTGGEGLLGETGRVVRAFALERDGHHRGMVQLHGELWRATAHQALEQGQACRVDDRDGLTLHVVPEPEQMP